MWRWAAYLRPAVIGILMLGLAGCAHTGDPANSNQGDPLEPWNRAVFSFNDKLDRAAIKPAARGYQAVVPARIRKHVGNFFRNLNEPTTIVNDLLQGNVSQAANDFLRFALNSTFGMLGLLDMATPAGLPHHEEDFGQTLRLWGLGSGPYLVLPLLGPSTTTDGIGLVPAALYTDPRTAIGDEQASYGLLTTNIIDSRSRALGTSTVLDLKLDPYVFMRETYLQRREDLVRNGAPSMDYDWE